MRHTTLSTAPPIVQSPNIAHLQACYLVLAKVSPRPQATDSYLGSGSHEGTVMTVAGTEVGMNIYQDLEEETY
jgi:hypothetical protein